MKKKIKIILIVVISFLIIWGFYYTRTVTIGQVINTDKVIQYLKSAEEYDKSEKSKTEFPKTSSSVVKLIKSGDYFYIKEYDEVYNLIDYLGKQEIHKELGSTERKAINDQFKDNKEDYYSITVDVENKKEYIRFELEVLGDNYVDLYIYRGNKHYRGDNYFRLKKPMDLSKFINLIEKYGVKE